MWPLSAPKQKSTACNHKIYRIDTGISRAFGGTLEENKKKMQVLQIKQNKVKVSTSIIFPNKKIRIM